MTKAVHNGWEPLPSGQNMNEYMNRMWRTIYQHSFKMPGLRKLTTSELRAELTGLEPRFQKCVFAIYGSVNIFTDSGGPIWSFLHAYFNASAAFIDDPEIMVSEDGYLHHASYPLLKMGVYKQAKK